MRRTGTCASCHHEKSIHGRGLCPGCYKRLRRHGDLDQYPLLRPTRPHWRLPERDDIDEMAVERVLTGDWRLAGVTAAERAEVCRIWVERGRPLTQLARLTGWAPHRYYRIGDERDTKEAA